MGDSGRPRGRLAALSASVQPDGPGRLEQSGPSRARGGGGPAAAGARPLYAEVERATQGFSGGEEEGGSEDVRVRPVRGLEMGGPWGVLGVLGVLALGGLPGGCCRQM